MVGCLRDQGVQFDAEVEGAEEGHRLVRVRDPEGNPIGLTLSVAGPPGKLDRAAMPTDLARVRPLRAVSSVRFAPHPGRRAANMQSLVPLTCYYD